MRRYIRRKDYPIIKYNPKFRNEEGGYTKNEWISYSDIGNIFEGKLFVKEDYLKVEELYVKAAFLVLEFFSANRIKVNHVFKLSNYKDFKKNNDLDLYETYDNIRKGDIIKDKQVISQLLKLRLREYIVQLDILIDRESRSEIIFGFDYYMYLRTNVEVDVLMNHINGLGLFTSR